MAERHRVIALEGPEPWRYTMLVFKDLGLLIGCGFSGHGFKLSPAVGRVLAQEALGLPTDVPLAPYALERFRDDRWLVGRYGAAAVA